MVVAAVLAVCVAALLAIAAWSGFDAARRYGWFVRDHYRLSAAPPVEGQCVRLRCTKLARLGSRYCSDLHETDAAYNDAGF